MKFLCPSCKAKYQLADEKVSGRSVRMKCRKCGHMLHLSGPGISRPAEPGLLEAELLTETPAPASGRASVPYGVHAETMPVPPDIDEDETTAIVQPKAVAAAMAAALRSSGQTKEAPATDGWFVGINGVPVGPIKLSELRSKAATGAITLESLTWREGCDEWRPLKTFPELALIVDQVQSEALAAAERIAQARSGQTAEAQTRAAEAALRARQAAAARVAELALSHAGSAQKAEPAKADASAEPAKADAKQPEARTADLPQKPAKVEAPKTEAPKAEVKVEAPKADVIKAEPPRAPPPRVEPHAAPAKPETAKPELAKPEASKPEASKPEASKPEASKPEPPKVAAKAEVKGPPPKPDVAKSRAPAEAQSPASERSRPSAPLLSAVPRPSVPRSAPRAAPVPSSPDKSPASVATPPAPPSAASPAPAPAETAPAASSPAAPPPPPPPAPAPLAVSTLSGHDLMPAVTPSAAPAPVAPSSAFAAPAPPTPSVTGAAAPLSIPDPFGANASTPSTLGVSAPARMEIDYAIAPPRPSVVRRAAIGAVLLGLGLSVGFVLFSPGESPAPLAAPPPTATATESVALPSIPPPEAAPTAAAEEPPAIDEVKGRPRSQAAAKPKSEPEAPGKLSGDLKNLGGPAAQVEGPRAEPTGAAAPPAQAELGAGQLQSTVARYTAGVKRSCWQPALETRDREAPSSARVNVTITIAPSGSVQDVSTSGDPRGYPGLSNCIAGRVRGWQFPQSGASTTLNVPFVFAAQ